MHLNASFHISESNSSHLKNRGQPRSRGLRALTVQSLNASDVVPVQLEVATETGVDRGHQGASELGVTQAQSVADFVGGHDTQIGAII